MKVVTPTTVSKPKKIYTFEEVMEQLPEKYREYIEPTGKYFEVATYNPRPVYFISLKDGYVFDIDASIITFETIEELESNLSCVKKCKPQE